MDEMLVLKAAARNAVLARRRALAPEEVAEKSARIAGHVQAMDAVREGDTLLTYVDSKDNEVETRGLIAWALEAGKRVLVPVTDGGVEIQWSVLERLEDLEEGSFGILEPKRDLCRFVSIQKCFPCLVPGVAFTQTGARLGFGRGCFDRFLSSAPVTPIALAFETQLEPTLPVEEHDVPMHWLVTESGPRRCEVAGGS